jgi:hypothetical protein
MFFLLLSVVGCYWVLLGVIGCCWMGNIEGEKTSVFLGLSKSLAEKYFNLS